MVSLCDTLSFHINFLFSAEENRVVMRYIKRFYGSTHWGKVSTMKNVTLYTKWLGMVFAALILAACSNNDTKEQEAAAAAAAEQAAQEAAAQEAAQREAQAEAAASQREAEAAAQAVGTIFYFDFDSSSLTDEARAQVDAHVAALLGNNDSVRLEGHTDERGTREYNLALGERRANAVRDYMVANGVPSYRIETVSYGEENPVAYGSGESNWQQNRRVELK
jgi:peptidoglycan-associated lipoprotein